MLTRALMLNPLFAPAAPRTAGRYLTREANPSTYNVTWDPVAKRLVATRMTTSGIPSAVSSNARVALRMSNGRVGIYSVTAAGPGAAPLQDFAYPSSSTLSLLGMNGNADVLFSDTGSPATFTVKNLVTGASQVTTPPAGSAGVTISQNVYNTGDGWLVQIPSADGSAGRGPAWAVNGGDTLVINYQVDTSTLATPMGCLATIGRSSAPAKALALGGIPRVLPAANQVFLATVTPSGGAAALNQLGAGSIAIPARLYVQEVNLDPNGSGYLASIAKATWYGYIAATISGTSFVPMSVVMQKKLSVPCSFIGNSASGAAQYRTPSGTYFEITATPPTFNGADLRVVGVLPKSVCLTTGANLGNGNGATVSGYKRTADRSGNLIADPVSTDRLSIFSLPHLGATVCYGTNGTSQSEIVKVQISTDGGLSFITGAASQSSNADQDGQATGLGLPSSLLTAIPLFL